MGSKYKIDAVKRVVPATMVSESFSVQEKFAYLLGMRSMARICAGDEAGVTRLMQKYIDEGAHRS